MNRLAIFGAIFLSACSTKPVEAPLPIRSEYTSLEEASCRKEVDRSHPNEITYLVCPGVAGYTLNVRRVEAGQRSIEVVEPNSRRVFALNYQDVITRAMFSLENKVEWRVAARDGRPMPVALIAGIQAREATANPQNVTTAYIAVAKVTPDQVCVTDRFVKDAQPDDIVRRAADAALDKPCAPALPAGQNQ
jgi:hypothetical protein